MLAFTLAATLPPTDATPGIPKLPPPDPVTPAPMDWDVPLLIPSDQLLLWPTFKLVDSDNPCAVDWLTPTDPPDDAVCPIPTDADVPADSDTPAPWLHPDAWLWLAPADWLVAWELDAEWANPDDTL